MLQNLMKLLITGGQVVGRAFARAVRQELRASEQAAARMNKSNKEASKMAAADLSTKITLQEAKEILNVSDIHDVAEIEKNYNHLFGVNDKSKGGSLYLQAKVYRAKERIDLELQGTQTSSGTEGTSVDPDKGQEATSVDPDKKTSSET